MTNNIIAWLSKWYSDNCDGSWEHEYGVKIDTLDNPGWSITIDLQGTELQRVNIPWVFVEKSDSDWYGYQVEDEQFQASGDPSKLEFLLELFKSKIVEQEVD